MSAGIAAAMVRAACKHHSIPTLTDAEEVMEQVAFYSFQLLHTPEVVGVDFVDSIAPVHICLMQWTQPNIHSVQSGSGSEFQSH